MTSIYEKIQGFVDECECFCFFNTEILMATKNSEKMIFGKILLKSLYLALFPK